jgi:hypothetical protein
MFRGVLIVAVAAAPTVAEPAECDIPGHLVIKTEATLCSTLPHPEREYV